MDQDRLAATFRARAEERVNTLDALARRPLSDHTLREMIGTAFALRSEAQGIGYEFIAEVVGSLCHFCESPLITPRYNSLIIGKHLDVLRGTLKSAMPGDGGLTGAEVLSSLQRLIRVCRNRQR